MLHQDWDRDLELVRRVERGDQQAQAAFCERMDCVPRFLAALNARAGSPIAKSELLDHVQEVHLSVWKNLAKFKGKSRLESWVYGFCRNQVREAIRRKHTQASKTEAAGPEQAEMLEDVSIQPHAETELTEFRRYLKHLSAHQARVIELLYLEGKSYAEIAAALEVKESTAKKHHARALEKLEDILKPNPSRLEARTMPATEEQP